MTNFRILFRLIKACDRVYFHPRKPKQNKTRKQVFVIERRYYFLLCFFCFSLKIVDCQTIPKLTPLIKYHYQLDLVLIIDLNKYLSLIDAKYVISVLSAYVISFVYTTIVWSQFSFLNQTVLKQLLKSIHHNNQNIACGNKTEMFIFLQLV